MIRYVPEHTNAFNRALCEELGIACVAPQRPSVHVITSDFAVYYLTADGVTVMYVEGEPVASGRGVCNTHRVDC